MYYFYHLESDSYFSEELSSDFAWNECAEITVQEYRRAMIIPDFIFNLSPGDVVYDIETYPNCFTLRATHVTTQQKYCFEISFRRDDRLLLFLFIDKLRQQNCTMVGFNSIGFDYPVVHWMYRNRYASFSVIDIYNKAMSIINAPFNEKFAHVIWEDDWVVDQLDLFKIHHFDNIAKSTSLKVLEFNMRMESVEDLPFPVGTMLTSEQIDVLLDYNDHDNDATEKFLEHTQNQIKFRKELTKKYEKNFMNHNDTKIGKDYIIMELEKHTPGSCYRYIDGKRRMVQTHRESINLSEVLLPYIRFEQPEFQRIFQWFKSQIITETKGVFTDINCTIAGFQFDFGTGGIHGSIESQIVESDLYYIIEDWDVASYYPNLAIANELHPAHLGSAFCDIYQDVYEQRKLYAKDTAENAMLKLALNGVYGDSNNQYSPFFDPQYTMAITINGQLLLCMLAESLMKSADLQMVQINTDGLTVRYPRHMKEWVHLVAKWWEDLTKLELEHVEYKRMFIRDVNNYLAEDVDGKIKRKGAYAHETVREKPNTKEIGWNQNHSALVIPKAAEYALLYGKNVSEFIDNHEDVFDFFLRTKVPRSSMLKWGHEQVPNVVRYYMSSQGKPLEKIMPPAGPIGAYKRANKLTDGYFNQVLAELNGQWDERIHTKNKSVYEERHSNIHTGWNVELCNDLSNHVFKNIDYEWYIREAEKLVEPLLV